MPGLPNGTVHVIQYAQSEVLCGGSFVGNGISNAARWDFMNLKWYFV